MGVPVTVDSDDLLLILEITGTIKNVERALNPSEKPGEVKRLAYTAAHDRAATLYRRALRGDDQPAPTANDIETLRNVDAYAESHATVKGVPPAWRNLQAKGLIEFGTPMLGMKWGDSGDDLGLHPLPEMSVRLTAKGHAALNPPRKDIQ